MLFPIWSLLATAVTTGAPGCVGLHCVFAGNTTWSNGALQATLRIELSGATDAPATLELTAHTGTRILSGLAAWDDGAREMLVTGDGWRALSSATAPTVLLLQATTDEDLPGTVHSLAWQRPLPRGELARYPAAATALAEGDAAAGSLGAAGGAVLIQSLEDGRCLLSGGADGGSLTPVFGACDAPEAVWAVGGGATNATRSLRAVAGTANACLRLSKGPLGLGPCAYSGTTRWSVLPSGVLASAGIPTAGARVAAALRLVRPPPPTFCIRAAQPSDVAPDAATLETAPCDAPGAILLRAVPAPGLAPRAALGQRTPGAAAAAQPKGGSGGEALPLTEPQFDLLRAALHPASRRQLASGGADHAGGAIAAILGRAGDAGAAAVPWVSFVDGVLAAQRSALAAASAAATERAQLTSAATQDVRTRAAELARKLEASEAEKEKEGAARRAAEKQLEATTRSLAATSARLSEAAAEEQALKAESARAGAYAEGMRAKASAAEALALDTAALKGELAAKVRFARVRRKRFLRVLH